MSLQLKYDSAGQRILTDEEEFKYCKAHPPCTNMVEYIQFIPTYQLNEYYDMCSNKTTLEEIGRAVVCNRWDMKSIETKIKMLRLCGYDVEPYSEPDKYKVIGYKTVRSDMTSIYDMTYQYELDTSHEPKSFDPNEQNESGAGISIWTMPCAIKYALTAGMEPNNIKVLKMSAHLEDVVLVNHSHKIRAKRAIAEEDVTDRVSAADLTIVKSIS